MYNNRMDTIRSSSRLLGGVCLPGAVCPRGCLPARGMSACQGDVCLPGMDLPAREVCLANTHPPPNLLTEFLTHACENITFPLLRLRTLKLH